ncbi:hypothetical protein GCK72_015993 [Caenorhabditis remanei]|uniref:Homeobox domain-containing protein n=1 Tax=Caenorhabditis remanei TaxID=31234 RepID=A0A6A5GY63_CAERE|nr:hypothetical protein GCK72_015993 [Caenorhabditis remanei]KAF1759526.1 hypothetical protein GCK72_015993 [Caenorhabditis remanei]
MYYYYHPYIGYQSFNNYFGWQNQQNQHVLHESIQTWNYLPDVPQYYSTVPQFQSQQIAPRRMSVDEQITQGMEEFSKQVQDSQQPVQNQQLEPQEPRQDWETSQQSVSSEIYNFSITAQADSQSKQRQKRTKFTKTQLSVLEARFEENNYISTEEGNDLAAELKLNPMNVRNWFRNRRVSQKTKLDNNRKGKKNVVRELLASIYSQ